MVGLGVYEVQPLFYPLDSALKPVDSAGDRSIIGLKRAKAFLDLTHILTEGIHCAPDVAEVFKDKILSFSCHGRNVTLRQARVKPDSFK